MPADDPTTLHAAIEHDVKAYSDTFVRANQEDDPSLMRPWLHLPVLILGNGTARALTTLEEVDAQYAAGVAALRDTDYADSLLSDFRITVLNPTTAFVLCHCVRSNADGSVHQEFEASYVVVKSDDHWRVASLISRR
ncbi:MAG TPA: hypothetical protein QGF05_11815 [Dehalococcoidia bacterium]|nr:hypothetical protein [Dehalococcoidia bacterium]